MSYRICANDLPAGELQADVMLLVAESFECIGKEFFVIGATARDVLAKMLKSSAKRKTSDLDITVSIATWDDFEIVMKALLDHGFRRDKKVQQRLFYGHGDMEFTLDVVPFGGIAIPENVFSWPGEPDIWLFLYYTALSNWHDCSLELCHFYFFSFVDSYGTGFVLCYIGVILLPIKKNKNISYAIRAYNN